MEAWVSVPIESRQIQRLIDQLGLRGGAPDLQQALADAIELWLLEQRKLQVGGAPCSVHGYQWKTVFLPDGTLLRTVSYHDEQCARVQGNEIIFNGRTVTPNQLAHWAGRGTRNAWNDIYVRRPQDKYYIHASRLRMLVQQEQARAQESRQPGCCAVAISQADAMALADSSAMTSNAVRAAAPPASCAAESAPRDGGKGEGWVLPERRKFRFRLEDVAFS